MWLGGSNEFIAKVAQFVVIEAQTLRPRLNGTGSLLLLLMDFPFLQVQIRMKGGKTK